MVLQAKLFDIEKENKAVLQELRASENQSYHLQNESENLRQSCTDLEAQLWCLHASKLQLKFAIQEEGQKYHKLLAEYDKYHKKMLEHKEMTSQLENRTPIMMQLEEKILMVKDLKAKKEELTTDFMNLEGNTIKQVQVWNIFHNIKQYVIPLSYVQFPYSRLFQLSFIAFMVSLWCPYL